jgi:hypothetical protein
VWVIVSGIGVVNKVKKKWDKIVRFGHQLMRASPRAVSLLFPSQGVPLIRRL